jgi:hypothetical protein
MMERGGGPIEWSEEHNTEFELEKMALICLSKKQIPDPDNPNKTIPSPCQPVTIHNHTIHPSKSHKFLGIIIDKNLNFKEHVALALVKGMKYAMACNRMIRPTRGIHGKLMRRLYESVVIPKMLYAADVWCTRLVTKGRGKKGRGRGVRGFASQLAWVQCMAMLSITGGLRSSASDLLDIHANILPLQQMIQKACHRATLRMATLAK